MGAALRLRSARGKAEATIYRGATDARRIAPRAQLIAVLVPLAWTLGSDLADDVLIGLGLAVVTWPGPVCALSTRHRVRVPDDTSRAVCGGVSHAGRSALL
jgi:hypothetical protein